MSASLAEKTCTPSRGGVARLTRTEARREDIHFLLVDFPPVSAEKTDADVHPEPAGPFTG